MTKIKEVKSESILDSRKTPTLSVAVILEDGSSGNFMVPSGASTGSHEAFELRDKDSKGVVGAIDMISNKISPLLLGMDASDQALIDKKLIEIDGTLNKSLLGGNSMIGVSVATIKAVAKSRSEEVFMRIREIFGHEENYHTPYLYLNLINGGKHTNTRLSFQEYHIVPVIDDVSRSREMAKDIQDALRKIIIEKYPNTAIGDEGGFALDVEDIYEPLDLLSGVVESLQYTKEVKFALDVAASSFYTAETKKYTVGEKELSKEELFETYRNIIKKYNILSIEDPFEEEDFESFGELQKEFPDIVVVGDDLTVTNIERLKKAISLESIKGIIIKPNQIGTMTETFETIRCAKENNIKCIVSHRSGETMDNFIADLVFGCGCFGIKSGAPGPRERDVKYERLEYLEKLINQRK